MALDVTVIDVATVNVGSSSTELAVVGADSVLESRSVEDREETGEALGELVDRHPGVGAVGHRLVHGGPRHQAPVVIDDDVRHELEGAADLAPLHMPPALSIVDQARRRLPGLPHVACLDTAFHRDLPRAARTYALPGAWRDRWDLRRYGFHGISYAWAIERTATLLGRPIQDLQVVLAHLGGGSSVCAVRHGRSVDTSMGLTPLEGVVMTTRSGSVDPGMLLWLLGPGRLELDELSDGLQHRSGLGALSDHTDTRPMMEAVHAGDDAAALALEVFSRSVRREIAAAATALERLDALVFTGEIGADQPDLRADVCAGLASLGIDGRLLPVDSEDAVLSQPGARVPVLVIVPQEARQMAAETRATMARTPELRRS